MASISIVIPQDIARWLHTSIQSGFGDVGELQRQKQQALGKRRTELVGMQDRLLSGYLAGAIEQAVFQTKAADLQGEIAEVEESLELLSARLCGTLTRLRAPWRYWTSVRSSWT